MKLKAAVLLLSPLPRYSGTNPWQGAPTKVGSRRRGVGSCPRARPRRQHRNRGVSVLCGAVRPPRQSRRDGHGVLEPDPIELAPAPQSKTGTGLPGATPTVGSGGDFLKNFVRFFFVFFCFIVFHYYFRDCGVRPAEDRRRSAGGAATGRCDPLASPACSGNRDRGAERERK